MARPTLAPETLLRTAVDAARAGGEVLRGGFASAEPLEVANKGKNDFVTRIDREAENAVVSLIRARHPAHALLAEESSTVPGVEAEWIIDPLDGTTNYIHRYPFFATSVAVRVGGEVVAGAVYDPVKDEMFAAAKGHGATLNGAPVRVSSCAALADALLVTGFPFRSMAKLPQFLASLEQLIRTSSGIRRDGSASLDCGYVACGRLDGFWECGLSAWDIAAGALLVEEAGGRVTDFDAGRGFLDSGDIVASPKAIHPTFLAEVQSAFR
ncbi:MAG: inositol monophosphatase [Acidobacteria bacterium]|nr:inositol monophosphatase [Acidobacteriota bacterium]